MCLHLLFIFAAIHGLAASGGLAAFTGDDGSSVSVVSPEGESVFALDSEPGERFSYIAFGELRIYCVSSSRGLLETDILTGITSVVSPGRTGAPWLDSGGDLWYTGNGSLYRWNDAVNEGVSAFHVSVENGIAAYTDMNDMLRILSLETGGERVVQGYRFYAPLVTPGGDVIAPTLTGEIVYLPADGSLMVVGNGEQPCWCPGLRGLFYCVSTDDGHELTGADLWFVRPGENPIRITSTPGVHETRPECSGSTLWYVDALTGSFGTLAVDELSL